MTNQEKIQMLLAEMNQIIKVIGDLCQESGIDGVDFLDQRLKFSIYGDLAVGGPRVFNKEWKYSTFDCHPSMEDWVWLHGPNAGTRPQDWNEGNE